MSTITVLWSLMAGAGFTIAATEILAWRTRRDTPSHLILAVAAAGLGWLALNELAVMKATSVADYATAIRWFYVPVSVVVLAMMAYVLYHLEVGRRPLAALVAGMSIAVNLLLNLVLEWGLRYEDLRGLRQVQLFGDWFAHPEATTSPWLLLGHATAVLFAVFMVDAGVSVWRNERRKRERLLMALFTLAAVLGVLLSVLSAWTELPLPIALTPLFQPALFLMALDLGDDVAESGRLVKRLEESEEHLRLAAEAAGFGVWTWDSTNDRAQGSKEWKRLFGINGAAEISLTEVLERIDPEDRAGVEEEIERSLREKGEFKQEFRIVLPDGTHRWLDSRGRTFSEGRNDALRLMGAAYDTTQRRNLEEKLRESLLEVKRLSDEREMENLALREQFVTRDDASAGIVGESEPVVQLLRLARMVAPTDSAVLITGETGTGKELLAQAIHEMSPRRRRPMVKVNCAALPAALIESELFGREKGAYTGAMTRSAGRFETADGSTLFLDEIAELPLELQAKLLRVLQDGKFERLGSTRTQSVDVRVIAATNRNLEERVAAGQFREDLFHRLNVFPIRVPPLRERTEDIPLLVWDFVKEFNRKMGRSVEQISRASWDDMKSYPWPGNVRELKNVLERAMILSDGRTLKFMRPATPSSNGQSVPVTLEDAERAHIEATLARTRWKISGPGGAAEVLGLPPTTLHSRMKKLGISRP